jgi:hypothetical protein
MSRSISAKLARVKTPKSRKRIIYASIDLYKQIHFETINEISRKIEKGRVISASNLLRKLCSGLTLSFDTLEKVLNDYDLVESDKRR